MPIKAQGDLTLPLRCPKCGHDEATLFVNSVSVLTVQCAECGHTWSTEIASLPDRLQRIVPKAS